MPTAPLSGGRVQSKKAVEFLLHEEHQGKMWLALVESLLTQDALGQTEKNPGSRQFLIFVAKFS